MEGCSDHNSLMKRCPFQRCSLLGLWLDQACREPFHYALSLFLSWSDAVFYVNICSMYMLVSVLEAVHSYFYFLFSDLPCIMCRPLCFDEFFFSLLDAGFMSVHAYLCLLGVVVWLSKQAEQGLIWSTQKEFSKSSFEWLDRFFPSYFADAKRLIGRQYTDALVQSNIKLWPLKVIAGPGDKPMICVQHKREEKRFATEEISTMVLIKMKEIAQVYLGSTVKNAVITSARILQWLPKTSYKGCWSHCMLECNVNQQWADSSCYSLQSWQESN